MFSRRRARAGIAAPRLSRYRQALRGITYKRGLKETRGRKAKYSRPLNYFREGGGGASLGYWGRF